MNILEIGTFDNSVHQSRPTYSRQLAVIQAGQTHSSGETLPKSYGTAVKDVSPFLLRGEALSSFSVARHSIFASDQFPVSSLLKNSFGSLF